MIVRGMLTDQVKALDARFGVPLSLSLLHFHPLSFHTHAAPLPQLSIGGVALPKNARLRLQVQQKLLAPLERLTVRLQLRVEVLTSAPLTTPHLPPCFPSPAR